MKDLTFMGDAYPATVQSGFNAQRYYAETGESPQDGPGQPETASRRGAAPLSAYLPFVVLVGVLWALERRHHGLGFNVGLKSS